MKPDEVGKRIQEIYPQYAEVPAAQLGARFLLKHGEEKLSSLGFDKPEKEEAQEKVSGMAVGERKQVAELASALQEMKRIQANLEGLGQESVATGPVGKILRGAGTPQEQQVREDLGTFVDRVRKGIFGGAFTETEKRVANLPGVGRQENRNRKILNSLIKTKEEQLKSTLKVGGLEKKEIDSFLEENIQAPEGRMEVGPREEFRSPIFPETVELGKQIGTGEILKEREPSGLSGVLLGPVGASGQVGRSARELAPAIASSLVLPELLRKGGQAVGRAAGRLRPSSKIAAGVAEREAAAKAAQQAGRKISGRQLVSKVEQGLGGKSLNKVAQAKRRVVRELLDDFTKEFGDDLIDPVAASQRLQAAGAEAFTKGGSISRAASAKFESAVNFALRDIFKDVAPGVLSGSQKIAAGKTLEKILSPSALARTGVGAGAATIGGGLAGFLLGRGRR